MAGKLGGKGSKAEKEASERRHELCIALIVQGTTCFKYLVVGATIVGTALTIFYLPVAASSGKETTVNVLYGWAASWKADVAIAWSLAGFEGLIIALMRWWWLVDRKRQDQRLREFERARDPNVTSSGLTPSGSVEKGDAQ